MKTENNFIINYCLQNFYIWMCGRDTLMQIILIPFFFKFIVNFFLFEWILR